MEEKRRLTSLGAVRTWYDDYFRANGTWPTTADYAETILRLLDEPGAPQRRRLLDVACGGGYFLAHTPAEAFERFGVDLSGVAAAEAHCRTGLPIGVASAEALPFADGSIDVVVCLGSFEHFVDKEASCAEFLRVTRPGGRVLVLVPYDRHWIDTDPQPIELVGSPKEWSAWFRERGLRVDLTIDTDDLPVLAGASPRCTVLRMRVGRGRLRRTAHQVNRLLRFLGRSQ